MRRHAHFQDRTASCLPLACALMLLLLTGSALAQTTAFTYQGKLTDSGNPANGNYDLQFKLYDTPGVGSGTQQGTTVTVLNVTVSNGIFTVQLDFGVCASCFDGSARYLEIAVKPTSGATFTTLGPRQPFTSTPYAIKSLNAATADGLTVSCVNCITSSQIQSVQGSQITGNIAGSQINGAIPVASVPAGSANYIQNGSSQQAATNFNIGGTGTAGILNATTQFNLNGSRVLSNPGTRNFFVGVNAGASNSTGINNSFVGINAGFVNTTGGSHSFFGANAGMNNSAFCCNSFFGAFAGANNMTGTSNSFFGNSAGENNSTSSFNSFFGHNSGQSNTAGSDNSFFGESSGHLNTVGTGNTFFGSSAGANNTTGNSNAFFGAGVGNGNTTGSNITLIGAVSNVGADNLNFATAIGAQAVVSTSNTVVLGRNADTVQVPGALIVNGTFGANILNATTQFNLGGSPILLSNAALQSLFVGIGVGAVNTGSNNAFFGFNAGSANTTGSSNAFFGYQAGFNNTDACCNAFFGDRAGLNNTGPGNSFFGDGAGFSNTTANQNSFFGAFAGDSTTTGAFNSFFGYEAGSMNTTGASNAFFGRNAGLANTTGSNNTIIGADANVGVNNLTFATAIGAGASVNTNNSVVLGRSSDQVRIPGMLLVSTLGATGSTTLCRNVFNIIAGCSSSLRYKTNVQTFTGGLDLVRRLRPITFTWKDGGMRDVGFAAEEVEQVEPLLTTRNAKGEVEGVKYDRIAALFVNAFKEQQAQIKEQRQQIDRQQREIELLKRRQLEFEALKKLICSTHPKAEDCKARRR